MLDPKTEKALAKLTEGVREVFGNDLVSFLLYGSAAGDDFVVGRSDLNCAIILERITHAHLKKLHAHLANWHKLGMAVPLLLDRKFLENGRDVFPMELHDMQAQHRLLAGEDVISALQIDGRNLRYQAEHEARSKLLRLRALYAEVGADRSRLEGLLLDSVKTFVILMRNLSRLRNVAGHRRYEDTLTQFESSAGASFPTMRHLLRVRSGSEGWRGDVDGIFEAYLEEVERLVDLIDGDETQ
ncbi:MAG TPA: hypothetical protein VMT89_07855 [Candidatus Acidoferrales bacterium]|nr:hypothetical protein [Candidatus Acidoferrales bacterium]